MQLADDGLRLSATDLANFLACRHLTRLDLDRVHGRIAGPPRFQWQQEEVQLLRERGDAHEAAYVEALAENVARLETRSQAETERAMRNGVAVIVQATLGEGRWMGRADVLRRVDEASGLGDWAYEVVDTKLSRQTKAGTILQLCLYSELLGEIQGRLPERMHVVSPGIDPQQPFATESHRVQDYMAYYRLVRDRLDAVVAADGESGETALQTYPDPVPHCDICNWRIACGRKRHDDDHSSLVASLPTLHRKELEKQNIGTLTALAQLPLPLPFRPKRGSVATLESAREQARVQLEGRNLKRPYYELLPLEDGRGLAQLPEPSPGDVFFDIEGARYVGHQGFEYLFGWAERNVGGEDVYHAEWAFDPNVAHQDFDVREKAVFEQFVDVVMERRRQHPDMHIYHFAPYEPSALKRLMGRYATRGEELDLMLRGGLFVDLHSVVRRALRASVEQYSIKDLEPFYDFKREVELPYANDNRHQMERLLETNGHADVTAEMQTVVERYNKDDCISTLALRDWLETIRERVVSEGKAIARPPLGEAEPKEEVAEKDKRAIALRERLLQAVPEEASERSPAQQAVWLLAYLIDWHRREAKSQWWEFFRLQELPADELRHENKGIVGLHFVEREEGRRKGSVPTDYFRYDEQDATVLRGDQLHLPGGDAAGEVLDIDPGARTLTIKRRRATADVPLDAVYAANMPVGSEVLEESLWRLGDWVARHGIDAAGPHRAARDLLLRRPPRRYSTDEPLQKEAEAPTDAAIRLVQDLDHGALPIQGPPGTGKTYTGARMICALVRAGKTVGITANSHSVIRNLLNATVAAAEREGLALRCLQRVPTLDKKRSEQTWPVKQTDKNDVLEALQTGEAQVGAGTAWLWSRPEYATAVDVLFVDEAGQMALANTLAVAQAAKNLVLLGDPQQLDQPLQGSHPDGADASALSHLLGEHRTMPAAQGLFLDETWRLHPSIAEFTSELFYENALRSKPDLAKQLLTGTGEIRSGLWFLPVEHDGNQSASEEEAEQVAQLVSGLLARGADWTDRTGERHALANDDVLIVSPYNAHLAALRRRLPNARIGTVDKFQGQEAPVVVYSMATSAAEDAPRGMEFLFNLNRLNVATSRARCATILVASPRLLEPDCQSPRQMLLANALCRYRELADVLTLPAPR